MLNWQVVAVLSACLAYLAATAETAQSGVAFASMGAAAGLAAILMRGGGDG